MRGLSSREERGIPSEREREEALDIPTSVSLYLRLVNAYQDAQLHALADPTRRAILARLRAGPAPVGAIARHFPVTRPAISQHLKVLKDARLVADRPEGNRRLYRLDPAGFGSLREYLDQFWTDALSAFQKSVDERRPRRRR